MTALLKPTDASGEITWTTSNSKVATVDDGTVIAAGVVTAVITATVTGGKPQAAR